MARFPGRKSLPGGRMILYTEWRGADAWRYVVSTCRMHTPNYVVKTTAGKWEKITSLRRTASRVDV